MPRALTSQKIPPLTDTRSLGQRAWLDEAACATMPVDQSDQIFFPKPNAKRGDAIWDEGRILCEGCPVRDACLTDALANEPLPRFGYVGGKTPDEHYAISKTGKRPSNGGRRTGLSPDDDADIARRYLAGSSTREIGEAYGVHRNTIAASLHRTRTRPRKPRSNKVSPCGTRAAYERHRRKGELPCEPCFEAKRAYSSQRNEIARERKSA